MKNIGEKIFERIEGEPHDVYEQRVKDTKQIFKDALDTVEGRRLLALLTFHSPPFAPRFASKGDSHQAAFLDGEKHLLGLMVVHGAFNG